MTITLEVIEKIKSTPYKQLPQLPISLIVFLSQSSFRHFSYGPLIGFLADGQWVLGLISQYVN